MVTHKTMPRLIENEQTGARIVFGWSPHTAGRIRYLTSCTCGESSFELIAPPETNPETWLYAARDFHLRHYPDCTCMDTGADLTAYRN